MRRTEDPFWAVGLGFGPVRSTAANLRLPWESGPYAFLSRTAQEPLGAALEDLLRLPVPVALPPALPADSGGSGTVQDSSVRPPAVRPSHEAVSSSSAQEKRQAALSRWNYVLRTFPALFAPATVLQTVTGDTQADLGMLEIIFSRKSTNTLNSRCSAVKQFCTWWRQRFPQEALSEGLVFLYVKALREAKGSASGPDSLLGGLAFVHGTLGSARITGLAHLKLRERRPPQQGLVLSTAEVRWLETCACGDPSEYDTLVVGALCFMLYARARHSDLDRAETLQQDWSTTGRTGFLECSVLNPKQTKASSRANRLLPIVAPVQGVTQDLSLIHNTEPTRH